MPLAFPSLNRGTIAFGFFNIESDMLILERCFFFADRFCAAVVALSQAAHQLRDAGVDGEAEVSLEGWQIDEPASVGHLHGAIAGVDWSGFIGATYQRFPFPDRPEGFKQSPTGHESQAEVTEMMDRFGRPQPLVLRCGPDGDPVHFGEIDFEQQAFAQLIDYVEHGGYPRYHDECRPSYVRSMMAQLCKLAAPWLEMSAPRGVARPSNR